MNQTQSDAELMYVLDQHNWRVAAVWLREKQMKLLKAIKKHNVLIYTYYFCIEILYSEAIENTDL